MIIYEGTACPPEKGYIAIVVSKFNRTITQRLLDGALATLKKYKVREEDIRISWVPGAFEIPLIARRFADDEDCQAVICLGAVIRGETSHDEHINRAVSLEIAKITTETNKPAVFGVLTCNTVEQAEARSGAKEQTKDKAVDPTAGNKGAEAAEVALEMIDLLSEIPEPKSSFDDMFTNFMGSMNGRDDEEDFEIYDYWDDDDEDEMFERLPPPSKKKKNRK